MPKFALPLRGSAITASNQATSPTNAPCHELPRVSNEVHKRRIYVDILKPSNATTVKDSVMSRPTAQPCALVVPMAVAATDAARLAISRETALLPMLVVLPQEVVVVDSEAVTTVSRTTVLLSATSVVVPTITREIARRKL